MNLLTSLVPLLIFFYEANGQKQEYMPMRYAVEGQEKTLPCAHPSDATFLKWKFHKNGTDFTGDAGQVFPPNIATIFSPFDTPPGRSEIQGGNLIIHQVQVTDEGDYWCEITTPASATAYSKKYPIHVYVTPQEPQVSAMGNSTLTEHQNRTVARCSSQGGKPGAKLKWMNGTAPISNDADIFYKENIFKDYLTDGAVDLKIRNPTRYDHNRVFSCVIEHPAYSSAKVLNYTIKVMYHPIKIRVWANLTSFYVYCAAEGFPAPSYHWRMPGGLEGFESPKLYIEDLFTLPGNDYFECTAYNGIEPNATIRAKVDDLRYPDGVPGWLGLDWWVWGVTLGSIAALIIIIVVVVCCIKRRRKTKKATSGYKKPIVKRPINDTTPPKHPNTLPMDLNYRRPDGREDSFDSRTPSPVNDHKRALIGGVFSKSQENVTLIPSEDIRRSRENVYSDNRKSMHASMEQLDQVASHIQTLNKSWDQLSKSRQQLNEAQDELTHVNPNLHSSREELYHSREALNRDTDQNYPYIDSGTTRSNEYYPQYDDERDGRRAEPQGYNSGQRYDDRTQGYDDRSYDQQQGYNTYQDDQRYDDRQSGYDRRNDGYNDRQYRQNENAGYDDRGYGYRQDGYNPRIV